MSKEKIDIGRPVVITLAGFDPSCGAGISADIKTLEQLRCYGMAVCTSLTVQNDNSFKEIQWTIPDLIKSQLSVLLDRYNVKIIKVGMVEDWTLLNELIDLIHEHDLKIKIILDPILNATKSKSESWHQDGKEDLIQLLNKVYLLTPNYDEIKKINEEKSMEENINFISSKCHIYLKGGHRSEQKGKDELILQNGKKFSFNPKASHATDKHGSGCILSAAIAGYLAKGEPLFKACFKGKRYTEKILSSNTSLLAYHH